MALLRANDFWQPNTYYYSTNRYKSLIENNNLLYLCNESHLSGDVFDVTKFNIVNGYPKIEQYTEAQMPLPTSVPNGTEVFNTTYQVKMRSNGTSWEWLGVGKSTWANKPDNPVTGQTIFITDIGTNGTVFVASATRWEHISMGVAWNYYPSHTQRRFLLIGGSGGTYSQTGNTITVTMPHTITSAQNTASVHLTISTGDALTGWFANFTYVDANTFTVESTVSQSTSGNLGTNTAETFVPLVPVIPTGMLDLFGDLINIVNQCLSTASAGTKTWRAYLNDIALTANTTQTTAGQYVQHAPNSIFMLSDSLWQQFGSANVSRERGNNTITFSMQLAASTDWALLIPWRLTFGQCRS